MGDNIFRWTVLNGACANPTTTDDVRIRVFNSSNPVANAGPDQELCSDANSTVLSGSNIILPASGTWTLVSGGGTIVTPNSPNTAVNNIPVGVNVFRWSVSNGPCANGNTFDEVAITVYESAHPAITGVPTRAFGAHIGEHRYSDRYHSVASHRTMDRDQRKRHDHHRTALHHHHGHGLRCERIPVDRMNGPCAFLSNSAQVTISVFDAAG